MPIKNLLIRPRAKAARPVCPRAEVAPGGTEATIWLYDIIDEWYGVDPGQLCQEIAAMIGVEAIHLRINSPGGDVFGARAIIAALRASGAKVIAHIDGLAASAATFIAVNCDEVRITDGGMFMIHQAATIAAGDAEDLRQVADLLDKVDGTICADYVRKTGQTAEQVAAWMEAETWFTADEAKAAGFVDVIDGAGAATVDNSCWDFSSCKNAPKALLQPSAAPAAPVVKPVPVSDPIADPVENSASDDSREAAKRRLVLLNLNC